uniref:Uncharacterized protein n=1 Tax=Oryza punctata TaxID=4537 RepID=A0A0E0KT08_ORYPU
MSRRSTLLQMLLDDDEELISLAIDIVHDNNDEVPKCGGSVLGHAVINQERLAEPSYLPVQFRRSQYEKIQDKEVHN